MNRLLLGVDIGGTKIAAALVNAGDGVVAVSERVPTRAHEGGPAVLGRALALAARLREQGRARNLGDVVGVGIGAGGQIDPEQGVVVHATDVLPGWAGTDLKSAFANAFPGRPIAADNDVNALAAGEARWGAGRGERNLVFLALGTGVGGALMLDGRPHHGAGGAGGELGHLVLVPGGEPCTCGGRGCLEQYVSGPALHKRFAALGGSGDAGASLAFFAERDPDGPAARAIAETGEWLGLGLVSLANIFGPDRFLIGGGLAELGERLLAPARRILQTRALPGVRNAPVVPAALGSDASVAGAAALVLPFLSP